MLKGVKGIDEIGCMPNLKCCETSLVQCHAYDDMILKRKELELKVIIHAY